ncbi:uncharacterized protein LOC110838392 isoform X3 [Zootermopsis nevadensis]|uniref:uncharacterized protein LOC110838392 isoform X3 n=1 Tax=Zootermopsis nevadensis TaxID=136037 RepID=UPI000B8EA4F9|nr:uncharacterized protein LOC110838392 isoform X3 [Zootermopsis nevadensis]
MLPLLHSPSGEMLVTISFQDGTRIVNFCHPLFASSVEYSGWPEGQYLGTQVLVANKDARFLRLWLETYRQYYPNRWYFNAGEKPTREVLWFKPELVHRVKTLFGVQDLSEELYRTDDWSEWRKFYAIHLLIRHRWYLDSLWNMLWWPSLHENNIGNYPKTFGEMAREVYF